VLKGKTTKNVAALASYNPLRESGTSKEERGMAGRRESPRVQRKGGGKPSAGFPKGKE